MLRRDIRIQDGKIDGVRKDVNNLAKVQPSENNIADVQHQVEHLDLTYGGGVSNRAKQTGGQLLA